MTWTIVGIIIWAVAIPTLLFLTFWLGATVSDRVNQDLRFRRSLLLGGGIVYGFAGALAIAEVVIGYEPAERLVGVPFNALMVWWFVSSALKTKVPPEQ
jgi:hypothetical protein